MPPYKPKYSSQDATIEVDLDLRERAHGKVGLVVTLIACTRKMQVRGVLDDKPKRFKLELEEPVVFVVQLDAYGILALAAKAAVAKTRRAKNGPVAVHGTGPLPKWRKLVEGEGV